MVNNDNNSLKYFDSNALHLKVFKGRNESFYDRVSTDL